MTKPQAEAERQWVQDNCPYCHGKRKLFDNRTWGGTDVVIIDGNLVLPRNDEGVYTEINIDYCPMCGRKL